jgi:urease accessory protein
VSTARIGEVVGDVGGDRGRGGAGAGGGWHAALELGFTAEDGATRLSRRAHRGPLVVQRPFLPEGPAVCHVYLLHPPGGLVGGDQLDVGVAVAGGAHALITTPAAGKVYRTSGAPVRQTQRLQVADGGTLEWLPQEAILYDGARATLETRVELAGGARFFGIDAVCFGLPARRVPFSRGSCRQTFELRRDGRPLLIERGHYVAGGAVGTAWWGLGGADVLAFATAAPAPAAEVVEAVRARAAAAPGRDLAAATVVGEGAALVVRYLGRNAEQTRAFLHDVWRLVRPALLGRAAVPPRVWAT